MWRNGGGAATIAGRRPARAGSVAVGPHPDADDGDDRARHQRHPDHRAEAAPAEQLPGARDHEDDHADRAVEDGTLVIRQRIEREPVLAVDLAGGSDERGEKRHQKDGEHGLRHAAAAGNEGDGHGQDQDDCDVPDGPQHRRKSYFRAITMMPSVTTARAAATATNPRAPNATAAAGRPSPLRSTNRDAPRIASEKMTVTPTPATNAAMTVLSNAWVSTIVPSIASATWPAPVFRPVSSW